MNFTMMQRIRDTRECGFTVIELLVVVLIIGVLASVAVPVFLNQRTSAQEAVLKSDMKQMALSIETWMSRTKKLPDDMVISLNHSGWSIFLRSDPQAEFVGLLSSGYPNYLPPGIPPTTISDGVAIGVAARNSITAGRGYCIVGNAEGSPYEASLRPSGTTGGAVFKYALYYDSYAGGGFYEWDEIPDGTSCTRYKNRVING